MSWNELEQNFTTEELAYCQLLRQGVKTTDMYIHADGIGLSVRAHNNEGVFGSLYIQLSHEDRKMFAMRYVLSHDEIDEIAISNTEYALKDYRNK